MFCGCQVVCLKYCEQIFVTKTFIAKQLHVCTALCISRTWKIAMLYSLTAQNFGEQLNIYIGKKNLGKLSKMSRLERKNVGKFIYAVVEATRSVNCNKDVSLTWTFTSHGKGIH